MSKSFIHSVDERTQLAGANRFEVLLFSLGQDVETSREEVFGINVFKVREVMHMPEITHAPDMPDSLDGMVCLRGTMVPVINLPKFCGIRSKEPPRILMITEYNKHIQGFQVHSVETIERLDWKQVKAPPPMIGKRLGGLVTAVSELPDKRLVMIMDVERVLADVAGLYEDETLFDTIASHAEAGLTLLFADDSVIARNQIKKTLERMKIKYIATTNGAEAWKRLQEIAEEAGAEGKMVCEVLQFVLTDVEMPEMDGYVLTQKIKSDTRFHGVQVIMHSSLSAEANQALGRGVGADAYVPKFEPAHLAEALSSLIHK